MVFNVVGSATNQRATSRAWLVSGRSSILQGNGFDSPRQWLMIRAALYLQEEV